MIRVRNIKVHLDEKLQDKIVKKLKANDQDIIFYKVNKQSIDARDKNNIHYVLEVDVDIKNEKKYLHYKDVMKTPDEKYCFSSFGAKALFNRPVIVGSGPAGLFCGYMLAKYGYRPLIIERGEKTENRVSTVLEFWNKNVIKRNSNVQFGEGGAGTFSDGKLNTLVKDKSFRMKKVFEIFVKHGAPEEIMYVNKPHIGTDKLREIVPSMRDEIIRLGGEFRYNTCLTDLIIENNCLKQIVLNNKEVISCDVLVLAIGHSARDTFRMLYDRCLEMTSKPFAVGIRIQHRQKDINKAQYGDVSLPPASYKLTYNTSCKRGVYSFCMCPGGYVVNSSSEEGRLVVNGMSDYKRDSENANSAIIVTVSPKDFGNDVFAGVVFQEELEKKAYEVGRGMIPVQLYKDYKDKKVSACFGKVNPVFKGGYNFSDLNDIFPEYVNASLKEGIEYFGTKIKGFNNDDAILAAVESRTSSPVRIVRDENFESNIKGIYPCGEGAGYAGGITTSAVDGIKVFEAIASKYSNENY